MSEQSPAEWAQDDQNKEVRREDYAATEQSLAAKEETSQGKKR